MAMAPVNPRVCRASDVGRKIVAGSVQRFCRCIAGRDPLGYRIVHVQRLGVCVDHASPLRIRKPDPTQWESVSPYPRSLLMEIFRRMHLIREFELRVNDLFLRGQMPGTIHLSHGQEATTVGSCQALTSQDLATLTHRGHGQALAKGVTPRSLMAELFGKETGCCRGMGGSLHVGDMKVGAVPAIAIVGASSPLAAGMAYAFKRRSEDRVVLNFFGDGTANKGDWHEAMNLAAVWRLPVIFLCENNLWAVSTHVSESMVNERIADRAAGYGMPGVTIDGNDPIAVYNAVKEARSRATSGQGPTLVECMTYRRGGHKRDDPATYRPKDEVSAWLNHDPVLMFRQRLKEASVMSEAEISELETAVLHELDEAVEFARNSATPPVERAGDYVYA